MIRRHVNRIKECGENEFELQNLTEDEFKEMLVCVMNTSVEQIHNVYSACSHFEHSTQVAQVMHICEKPKKKL